MNQGSDAPSLTFLIERILRFERYLERFMPVLDEGEAIGLLDRFALQHRVPNGKTVLDQFLASWPDLTAADREMLRGWATRWRGSSSAATSRSLVGDTVSSSGSGGCR